MSINLANLTQSATTAVQLANLALVTPQKTIGYRPQNAPSFQPDFSGSQKDSILFNIELENSATLTSDITDHFVEDNTVIQDQIARRPEMVTVRGVVAELNDLLPPSLSGLKLVAEKLSLINAFSPSLSASAIVAYNQAFQAYQVAAALVSVAQNYVSSIRGIGSGPASSGGAGIISGSNVGITDADAAVQTQQQIYFQRFYRYWANNTLFTVQTPWAVFQDMAINSLKITQDESTNKVSEIEIQFKLMRFASTISVATSSLGFLNGVTSGRYQQSSSDPVNHDSQLTPSTETFDPTSFA